LYLLGIPAQLPPIDQTNSIISSTHLLTRHLVDERTSKTLQIV